VALSPANKEDLLCTMSDSPATVEVLLVAAGIYIISIGQSFSVEET
jgi:hypothetical protein